MRSTADPSRQIIRVLVGVRILRGVAQKDSLVRSTHSASSGSMACLTVTFTAEALAKVKGLATADDPLLRKTAELEPADMGCG
jgi:hypothetical protein